MHRIKKKSLKILLVGLLTTVGGGIWTANSEGLPSSDSKHGTPEYVEDIVRGARYNNWAGGLLGLGAVTSIIGAFGLAHGHQEEKKEAARKALVAKNKQKTPGA